MILADPLGALLSRLEGVKKQGDRYIACCPAHNDNAPSLSLSRGEDGRALVHCYAGCEILQVLAAIGMGLRDLFPDSLSYENRQRYRREALERERVFEQMVIAISNGEAGSSLSDVDLKRLAEARERVDQIDRQLAELEKEHETPIVRPERPSWGVYESPVKNEKGRRLKPGVYWHSIRTDEEGERIQTDEWISSPVFVVARTINTDDGSEGRLLRLVTQGGEKEWVLPMEVFGGSGEDARRALFARGGLIAMRKRGAFMEYLLDQQPRQTIATTSQPGWHESGYFVLPNRTIGGDGVRYQTAGWTPNLYASGGSLVQWQELVALRCLGNPVLTLAIGCALAGPLLSLVGVNGGGVHLIGDSSSGKSLAQLIGASVWGNPGMFVASWDMTKGGLEIEAASRNDTLLCLDEIKRADPRRVQEMAYALANGQGKGTMTREREGRAKLYWRVLTLSSGERSLSEHATIGGNPAHAGAELRMVYVNAGTRTHRAFDDLHGMAGEGFHRALTVAASRNFGHLGVAFVERLTAGNDHDGLLESFAKVRAQFAVASAQAGRVADRFAVIALAGEMAITYGLLPWPAGACLADSLLLYREWLERVGSGNAEDRQILAGLASFIERHGSSRFSSIDGGDMDSRIFDRSGYWENEPHRRLYLFNKSGLIEAAAGYGLARIVKALESAGALAKRDTDRKRYTKKYRLPGGGSAGLYVIDPERLEGEGGGHTEPNPSA
ncbi:MAG: RNA helicase [Pseudomonas sp.]|nr:RNA helicase [Pseudomonas sp.]